MKEFDAILLTCVPVNVDQLAPELPEYPNKHYEQVKCERCEELMYMGPQQRIVYDTRKSIAMCMVCTVLVTDIKGDELYDVKDLFNGN